MSRPAYAGEVTDFRAAFPDLHTTLEDVRGTDRATHRGDYLGFPASGHEVTTTWIEIFRMENGKAAEGWLESDWSTFRNQFMAETS